MTCCHLPILRKAGSLRSSLANLPGWSGWALFTCSSKVVYTHSLRACTSVTQVMSFTSEKSTETYSKVPVICS